MSRVKTLQSLFKRYRRPGDIVFAWFVLALSLFLLSQLFAETAFKPGKKMVAQPRFWPAVSLIGMTGFATFHLIGSALSERIEGRWREVLFWASSLEYAVWFIAYAVIVPYAGYLPSTLIITLLLIVRVGFRSRFILASAATTALLIVVVFKSFLQVKLPAGQIYNGLPDGLRQIMLNYF